MKNHFISIKDLTLKEINDIFALASKLKKKKNKFSNTLKGKTLGLVFQKPSNRTRVAFAVGMHQLGGYCTYLGPQEINLGVREAIKDVSLTLSRYLDGVVLRTFSHSDLLEFVKYSTIPVINGLTDLLHPCQALSDLFTVKEKFSRKSGIPACRSGRPQKAGKKFSGITLAYVGDGNNVCHSLLYGCAKLGLNLNIATAPGYEPKEEIVNEARGILGRDSKIELTHNAEEAATEADIIYTDVWVSMGQENEREKRLKDFQGFQVNKELVSLAKKGCLIMHCLPAHRGEEITDEVIDSKNSLVFDQAENRLHVQKAILIKLLG